MEVEEGTEEMRGLRRIMLCGLKVGGGGKGRKWRRECVWGGGEGRGGAR